MPRTARKSEGEDKHEAGSLVGQAVQVPGWVFPRDPLPKGAKFWPGKVIGIAKTDAHKIYVKLDGTDEEFFFPLDEVQKWLSSPTSPATTHSAVRRSTRSQVSTRSGRQAGATAATPATGRKRRATRSEPEDETVRSQSAEADPSPRKSATTAGPGSNRDEVEPAVGKGADDSIDQTAVDAADEPATPPPKRAAVAGPQDRPGWGASLARMGAEAALGVASSLAVYAVAMAIQQGS